MDGACRFNRVIARQLMARSTTMHFNLRTPSSLQCVLAVAVNVHID